MIEPKLIESALDSFLEKHLSLQTPPRLAESIRYSLLSGGKRIRPRLLLESAQMLGITPATAMPAAIAIEMTHCFTLIHDDLPCMDNDDFRRGLPSNHKKFNESTALLAGDALIALAIEVFLESAVQPDSLMKGLKRLVWAMGPRGVIGGQAAEANLNKDSNLEELKKMHRQKTGALFSASILIPFDFSQASHDFPQDIQGKTLASFADALGLAFQIADDLEDEAQGMSQGPESRNPTSILFYLSQDEATEMASHSLKMATLNLKELWQAKADPLAEIAEEVLNKLKASAK